MSSKKEKEKQQQRECSEQKKAERINQREAAARQRSTVGLSELPKLAHAYFESVLLGPCRELTLTLLPLIWAGNQGQAGPAVTVRMGGIVNFEEVKALFAADHHKYSELGRLDYAEGHISKPGELYLHLVYERVEAEIVIHCHSLTITE